MVERFIEQEYLGTFDESATDGEALQLSAGNLRGESVEERSELEKASDLLEAILFFGV